MATGSGLAAAETPGSDSSSSGIGAPPGAASSDTSTTDASRSKKTTSLTVPGSAKSTDESSPDLTSSKSGVLVSTGGAAPKPKTKLIRPRSTLRLPDVDLEKKHTAPNLADAETTLAPPTSAAQNRRSRHTDETRPRTVRSPKSSSASSVASAAPTLKVSALTDAIGTRDQSAVAQPTVLAATLTSSAPPGESAALATPQTAAPEGATTTAATRILPRSLATVLAAFGLGSVATGTPAAPVQTPLWGLFAWARREFEQGISDLLKSAGSGNSPVATESVDLTASNAAAPDMFAAAAAAAAAPGSPVPGQQISASTSFVNWVTGNYPVNNTLDRFGISGTDVGIMWDNGIEDNPNTLVNEHQVLIAFGDTFGNRSLPDQQWRSNTLLRSSDTNLTDGLSVPNGQVGNIFSGSPLATTNFAKQIIPDPGYGPAVTIIPTAGISVPTPGTPYGATQYVDFMAVQQWGNAGHWKTSYSAIAYSTDNGQNWKVDPSTVRRNQWWTGNQHFQQGAFVRPGDGYVYEYGTPNGRGGSAYVARVPEADVLDLTKYEYYSAGSRGFFGMGATPAGWIANNPGAASAIMPPGGRWGTFGVGRTVSEMSVQYNEYLNKYVALYCDQFNNVVMRTADSPQGTWSAAEVLIRQQPGGIYAPMMHPWSPSTLDAGPDLYWNLSLWSEYNVMLMRTDLTKV
ncbi:MAG TPA: DUF4185 domain-containing protein [Mycobacterium sp.]